MGMSVHLMVRRLSEMNAWDGLLALILVGAAGLGWLAGRASGRWRMFWAWSAAALAGVALLLWALLLLRGFSIWATIVAVSAVICFETIAYVHCRRTRSRDGAA